VPPFVDIDVLGSEGAGEEVRVRVESNEENLLKLAAHVVRTEVEGFKQAQDYEGAQGRELRRQAGEFALARAQLLRASQAAYENGEHDAARCRAAESKAAGEEMVRLNLLARDAIFQFRNAGHGLLFLDLHGLYVKEALFFVKQRLEMLASSAGRAAGRAALECVTGAGNHSALGESKIRPAVLQLVSQLHYRIEEKSAGSFLILV
jgi:hypothetical protein